MKKRVKATSLAGLAVLVFGLLATPPVSAQSSRLAPDVLARIIDFVARRGTDRDIDSTLAARLGLSAPGQAWPSRQIATPTENGNYHGFAVSRSSDSDMAVSFLIPSESVHAFRVRRDGTLVAAVIRDLKTGQMIALKPADAQRELDAEYAFWTKVYHPTKQDSPKN